MKSESLSCIELSHEYDISASLSDKCLGIRPLD